MASKSEKPLKTIVKPRFFKDAPLFERYVFLFKTINIYLKNTVDNDIRSGNDFFLDFVSIWDLLETLLGPPGASWASLGVSWTPFGLLLGVPWRALGRFLASSASPFGALGPCSAASTPRLGVLGWFFY